MRLLKLSEFGTVVMGMSPSGKTYNEKGEGLPLLNGPTEFTNTCPIPKLYTIDSKRECKEGDLIFCVRGSTTGKMNWSDQIYSIGRGVCAIRGNNLIDTKYIRYCIEHNLQGLLSVAGGGTFPNLKKDDIGNFEIPIVDNREKIVEILSAYDDLIENNLKRIKLLEETAQNIYKEWFVNFRFPNYENTPINQETGLPEGWEASTLGNVCVKISSGGTPSRNKPDFWNEKDYPWVKTKELQDNFIFEVEEYVSKSALENSSTKLFQEGSVVMAIYASPTLGRLGILTKECCFNQAMVGFQVSNKISNQFLYLKLNEERKNLNNKAIGAAQQNISVQKVKDHEIILPNQEIIELFTKKVEFVFSQKRVLGEQNQKLKEARDILLPRLMNRTIEV
jgi:type I restriction enzyme S subunit